MNPSDHPQSQKRYPKWMPIAVLAVFIVGVFAIKMILPPQWHALLELKNTGTKAVTIVFKDHSTVTKPGGTWKGEFRAGEIITISGSDPSANTWHNLQMPAKNPKPWTPSYSTVQHWTAEVNADDPASIRVENRRYTEVTMPPSPWEPWP
ncbi:MAG: hypothetical protein ACKVY0_12750 [Prosthecobacter sp.]|uniref:hypothetical protein n=1 Tax=Prosthecobacter sp. TaxID=1965333 RepID=UPI003903C406